MTDAGKKQNRVIDPSQSAASATRPRLPRPPSDMAMAERRSKLPPAAAGRAEARTLIRESYIKVSV